MPKVKATVLIVDDDILNIQLLANGLGDEYTIVMANNGAKAIEIAVQEQPDLILLDVEMPKMNGYDVCKSLKRSSATKHIPIIFITGRDSDAEEVKGLELGASDYITKPFNMQLVSLRMKNLMQLKRKTDLLEKLASLDGLTDIPNRRQFDLIYDREWRRAVRSQSTISLLMLDIDFFKPYNDNYGHAAGDQTIIGVASSLEKHAQRAGDFVARYGGEEFVVIAPDSDLEAAMSLGNKLCRNIRQLTIPHAYSLVDSVVTISVGVTSMSPAKFQSPLDAIAAADEQLYIAKEAGRNRVSGIAID